MPTLYISPTGSGLRDGSSLANAGILADLPAFIAAAGAGGEVLLRADEGPYQRDAEIAISAGGAVGANVTVRGIDGDGNPMPAEIVGTRAENWSPGQAEGTELFRLSSGANNLTFQDLTIRNFGGGAFRVAADIDNLTLRQIDATNVQKFFEDQALSPATSASVKGLLAEQVTVTGYSKYAFELKYDTQNVRLENVTADSQRQNGGLYVVGVHIEGTAHDIVLHQVVMKNNYGNKGSADYWNGDGFGTERGTYNIRFEDTVASGNTDAGYDIKSSNTVLVNAVAEGNKHNYRIWSDTVTLQDSFSFSPVKLGGSGGVSHVEVMATGAALIDNLAFSDASGPAVLFDLLDGKGYLRVINTAIPDAYSDRIASLNESRIDILPPDGPAPIPSDTGNDAPTWIAVSGGVLLENANAGTVAATLTALDPDQGDSHTFAITGGATNLFEIVGNQIIVKTGAKPDYETRNLYGVNVTVTDDGGLSHSQTIILRLSDVRETGTSGNDVLVGSPGSDTLTGKTGNDTYLVDSARDILVERSNEGTDLANVAISAYTLATYVENLAFVGPGAFAGTGNSSNNIMTGGGDADRLDGANGNDTLNGGLGSDTLIGGGGNDKVFGGDGVDVGNGGAGNDSIYGDAGDDLLSGQDGTDTLYGGEGFDKLDGGAGNDKMLGGAGDDTYVINSSGDVVTELLDEGTDSVTSSVTHTLGANVENLALTGSSAINGSGNALNNLLVGNGAINSLTGGAGDDILDGAGGNDKLTGGDGADTYRFNLGGRQDTIFNGDTDLAPDKLVFGTGIDTNDLWFAQSGSNLVLTVLGTTDKVTISGWYSSPANQLDRIELSDGTFLAAGEVQTMVNAMSFSAPPASFSALTAAHQQALADVIGDTWHATA
jgi:Ca2+-binding RTX toxin-like protein